MGTGVGVEVRIVKSDAAELLRDVVVFEDQRGALFTDHV